MSRTNLPNNITRVVSFGEEDDANETYDFETEYDKLIDVVKEYVSSDCHAVLLDNEVIYNMYQYQQNSYRQRIEENVIRDKIIDNPHRHLFSPLLVENRNFSIEIFMFRENPWKLVILFDSDDKKFTLLKKKEDEE